MFTIITLIKVWVRLLTLNYFNGHHIVTIIVETRFWPLKVCDLFETLVATNIFNNKKQDFDLWKGISLLVKIIFYQLNEPKVTFIFHTTMY